MSTAMRLIWKRSFLVLPACRRLLFPLLHAVVPFPRATKEIGDVCTQAILVRICQPPIFPHLTPS